MPPARLFSVQEKISILTPLADRLHRGHCWVKTNDGPRRIAAALDDFKIAEHAAGRKAYGACPIAPGTSCCQVGVLDFDSHKGDVPWASMLDVASNVSFFLTQEGCAPVLFRSSGGSGIHLYVMWEAPQEAYDVRGLLAEALRCFGLKNGTKGVANNQAEIFPKQEKVPAGGFGSMFILPFAGKSELLEGGL